MEVIVGCGLFLSSDSSVRTAVRPSLPTHFRVPSPLFTVLVRPPLLVWLWSSSLLPFDSSLIDLSGPSLVLSTDVLDSASTDAPYSSYADLQLSSSQPCILLDGDQHRLRVGRCRHGCPVPWAVDKAPTMRNCGPSELHKRRPLQP
jgi:hypothetical protein